MDLQQAAKLALSFLERAERVDGASFVKTKDDAPEWVSVLCMDAHSGPPEDWRYEFIEDALHAIRDEDDEDQQREDMENGADVYNSKLAAWLASDCSRGGYVDEALEEMGGEFPGLYAALGMGQARERVEVLESVRSSLQDFVDDYVDPCEKCGHHCPDAGVWPCAKCGSDPMQQGDTLCADCDAAERDEA